MTKEKMTKEEKEARNNREMTVTLTFAELIEVRKALSNKMNDYVHEMDADYATEVLREKDQKAFDQLNDLYWKICDQMDKDNK